MCETLPASHGTAVKMLTDVPVPLRFTKLGGKHQTLWWDSHQYSSEHPQRQISINNTKVYGLDAFLRH